MKSSYPKKSRKFQELSNLIYIIYSETIRNIFSSSFFMKKKNVYFTIVFAIGGYLFYLGYNILELSKLDVQSSLTIKMITLGTISTLNTVVISAISCFLLVELVFKFSSSTIFMFKTFPFKKQNLNFVVYICKTMLAFGLFQFINVILTFLLRDLFHSRTLLFVFMLLIAQVLFLLIYNLGFIINVFTAWIINRFCPPLQKTGLFIITVLGFLHFFHFRFIIDRYLTFQTFTQNLIIKQENLVTVLLSILTFLVVTFLVILWLCKKFSFNGGQIKYVYILKNNMSGFIEPLLKTIKSLIRERTILACFIILIAITLSAFFSTFNIKVTIQTFFQAMVILVILPLYYYNTTSPERSLYNLFRFSSIKEVCLLLGSFTVIFSPYIVMSVISYHNYINLLLLTCLTFLILLLFGILFPKGKSAVNEFISVLLSGLVATLVIFLYQSYDTTIVLAAITILICSNTIILFKDRTRR